MICSMLLSKTNKGSPFNIFTDTMYLLDNQITRIDNVDSYKTHVRDKDT